MTDKEALKIYKEERRKQLKWKIKNFFKELPLKILALVTLILIVSIIAGPVIIGSLLSNLVLEIIGLIWIGIIIISAIIGCIVNEIKWHLTKKKKWKLKGLSGSMKMNRKTMQYLPNHYCNNYGVEDFEIRNKLGSLEDWEDLYGIDLLTLLKTEEVYWRIKFTDCSGYSEIQKSYKCYIDLHNHQLIVYSNEYDEFGYPLPFEEYGDTWDLTKEGLENEKND